MRTLFTIASLLLYSVVHAQFNPLSDKLKGPNVDTTFNANGTIQRMDFKSKKADEQSWITYDYYDHGTKRQAEYHYQKNGGSYKDGRIILLSDSGWVQLDSVYVLIKDKEHYVVNRYLDTGKRRVKTKTTKAKGTTWKTIMEYDAAGKLVRKEKVTE